MDFKERLRQRLNDLKNPKLKSKRTWNPPKDGATANLRLFANPFSSDPKTEPFSDLWFHYGVGGNFGILCPKFNNKEGCAICDFVSELRKSNEEKDKNMAKRISASQRTYAVVIDRADPTFTPKYWGFSKTVHIKLMEHLVDEDYENFLDPYKGNDVVVASVKAEGKLYPSTEIKVRPKPSPLGSEADIAKVLANIPPITEVFKPMTNAEIKTKLTELISGGSNFDPETMSNESTRGGGTSTSSNTSKESELDSVDKAFEGLAD